MQIIVAGHGLSLLTSARRRLLARLLVIVAKRGCCCLLLRMPINFAGYDLLLCGGMRSVAIYERW